MWNHEGLTCAKGGKTRSDGEGGQLCFLYVGEGFLRCAKHRVDIERSSKKTLASHKSAPLARNPFP